MADVVEIPFVLNETNLPSFLDGFALGIKRDHYWHGTLSREQNMHPAWHAGWNMGIARAEGDRKRYLEEMKKMTEDFS